MLYQNFTGGLQRLRISKKKLLISNGRNIHRTRLYLRFVQFDGSPSSTELSGSDVTVAKTAKPFRSVLTSLVLLYLPCDWRNRGTTVGPTGSARDRAIVNREERFSSIKKAKKIKRPPRLRTSYIAAIRTVEFFYVNIHRSSRMCDLAPATFSFSD